MTDASGQQISLDANVLDGTSDGLQITYQTEDGQTVTTIASSTEAADIVSKAFTTVADGSEANVEYVTMTPEEAAAAGVVVAQEEEEQVVTTSLQFDPANPSVLYTADGTPINQADLTPEEQALVQAALQQHLAEQEAEQQLAMMQEGETAQAEGDGQQAAVAAATDAVITTSAAPVQDEVQAVAQDAVVATGTTEIAASGTTASSTTGTAGQHKAEGIDLASPNTSASQIVQTLANNVRKQQMEENLKLTNQTPQVANPPPAVSNFSEKIVIREGQPQVVKVPAKKPPNIPEALASLMPKVEIGKDGSQVIRIHQSQITPTQLKALQENPNVRLVFRPASSTKPKPTVPQRKRGRPRKNPEDVSAKITPVPEEPEIEDPPAKTRCGRVSKRPVYTKDYLTPKISTELEDDDTVLDPGDEAFSPVSMNPLTENRKMRGRPPGVKAMKNRTSYASKIEALQNRDQVEAFPVVPKPALTPIEQALSTRRKNRLREMLSACSEDEIMEVAMPHLARVFSLWEFLVTKVEKNKMSRVYFADIYKEYECLHKYVSKLAEKYKQAVVDKKTTAAGIEAGTPEAPKNGTKESVEKDEKKEESKVQVTFMKLAESLGLTDTTLEEAEISLLDPEEAIGPRIMGMIGVGRARGSQLNKLGEDKNARKPVSIGMDGRSDTKSKAMIEGAKPTQAEATSTISTTHNASMPPLKPLGQTDKVTTPEATAPVNGTTNGSNEPQQPAETPMETDVAAQAATEAAVVSAEATGTGTQLIQIGQGEDQQFIEVPEGYTLIQTPEGLVMSQPGTTITQGEDGTIYITHADGTTTPLNAATQQSVPMETVESLLSLDGQQSQT